MSSRLVFTRSIVPAVRHRASIGNMAASSSAARGVSANAVTAGLGDVSGAQLLPLPASDGKPAVAAHTLWAQHPQVVLVTRRPGWQLCRSEAKALYAAKKSFDDLGVGLVCLLHENIPEEVDAYVQGFWPGPIYLDQEKDFYKAVGGGKIAKGSIMSFLNPFGRVWKNAKLSKDVKDANLKGDGLTMGGMMVISNKGVHYQFAEETFGDRAPLEDVLEAAKLASTA